MLYSRDVLMNTSYPVLKLASPHPLKLCGIIFHVHGILLIFVPLYPIYFGFRGFEYLTVPSRAVVEISRF